MFHLQPNTEIIFLDGTYDPIPAPISYQTNVTLRAENPLGAIIGRNRSVACLVGASGLTVYGLIIVNSTDIRIHGLQFRCFSASAIVIAGSKSNVTVTDTVFDSVFANGANDINKGYKKYGDGAGGCIYSEGHLKVRGTSFRSLSAISKFQGQGIAVFERSCNSSLQVSVENCQFGTRSFDSSGLYFCSALSVLAITCLY